MNTWSLTKFKKVQKIAAFVFYFFWFSVAKQLLEKWFAFPHRSEIPTIPASLKILRHFSTAAAFGNSVFFNGIPCQMIDTCI